MQAEQVGGAGFAPGVGVVGGGQGGDVGDQDIDDARVGFGGVGDPGFELGFVGNIDGASVGAGVGKVRCELGVGGFDVGCGAGAEVYNGAFGEEGADDLATYAFRPACVIVCQCGFVKAW